LSTQLNLKYPDIENYGYVSSIRQKAAMKMKIAFLQVVVYQISTRLIIQIRLCLQNVAWLLKSHHHLCKMDRIIAKNGFPAKNFIQINNTFAFCSEKL